MCIDKCFGPSFKILLKYIFFKILHTSTTSKFWYKSTYPHIGCNGNKSQLSIVYKFKTKKNQSGLIL